MDKYAKALVGAAIAGLGALGTALVPDAVVSPLEWVVVATASLGTLYGVWQIPNAPKES